MAAALIDYARAHSVEPQPNNVEEYKNFPGEGIYGKIDGKDIYIGNQKIASRAGCSQFTRNENNEGSSIGYIFVGSTLAGIFSLSDSCRIGVKQALEELKLMGIRTAMLTGDCQAAANYAQNQLGGALEAVHAELLPEDKAKIIKEFQRESKIAMVGDGVNDAPALATADIGISMGVSGSALANETGHIILMSNDIRKVPVAVKLARKTRRKIFENIFISILTKSAIIALAIAGHPLVWAAVLADVGTCLLVILNSMLLLQNTTSSRRKTHSGSSPDQTQCLSAIQKRGGDCVNEDNVQLLKHLVQESKENESCCDDGCCVGDDAGDDTNHWILETKGDCCAHDDGDEIREVKPVVVRPQQETKCCNTANETKCCDTTKVIKCCETIKETKCSDTTKVTKCCDTVKETKCGDTTKEKKCCETTKETKYRETTKETKCCDTTKVTKCCEITKETKCDAATKETKCCDTVKETECCEIVKETECCDVTKDLESQSCGNLVNQEKKGCGSIVKMKKDEGVKEYVTGVELGKVMKDCCKSQGLKKRNVSGCCKRLISNKCCGAQYFGGGFNRKGYLSEIVIE